ncbi:MAG: 4-(cytidine 5'-diphospho)-2-C-methyl-D-erythritol kinase [Desulfuromonadales bacterium]|nr:4-(cytidine 5'-diphospho)-2-C-methyl-D-erythritol kinase [Desulfuromonadales bacterium]
MQKALLAAAKINPILHVLRKRSDGYHDLAMLMQAVTLFDRITLTVNPGKGVEVVCPGLDLPDGADNIAARAAQALMAAAGQFFDVEIEIEKRIPVAAGLGGGSSDAATVLIGMNEMCCFGFEREELMRIGSRLGADVPFFVYGETAWATGIGDQLEPVGAMPSVWYVLVNPGIEVSTASVYGNLVLTSHVDLSRLRRFPKTIKELASWLHNDLEGVTMIQHPVLNDIKQQLASHGALGTLMSGSGPTVFGLFSNEEAAQTAAGLFSRESGWHAYVVQPLDQMM